MYRPTRLLVVLAAAWLLACFSAGAQTRPASKRKLPAATAKKPAPAPGPQAQPAAPPPPPTPEQMPPVQPQVTFQNGQLSIVAQNSTLRDVLSAVRARTGATLELPGDLSADRVVVHLGPGAPRDVLAQLLQGSRFDYVIVGYPDDPNAVQRVILTARASTAPTAPAAEGTAAATASPGGPGSTGPRPGVRAMPPEQVEEPENDVEEQQPEPQVVPQPPPPAPGQLGQPGNVPPPAGQPQFPGQNPAQPPVPGQPNPNPQIKTPEQLLQELQRMQQQQQQQQQQPQKPPPQ